MTKLTTKKKVFITITAVLAVFIALVGFLLIPRVGKKPDDYKWNGKESFDINNIQVVNKEKDEPFTILQLTDPQLFLPFQDTKQLKNYVDTLVNNNEPDLITVTGDLVAGVFTHFQINDMIKIFDSYGIPWAPVFGNHDRELNASLYYQSKKFGEAEHCLFQEGPNNIHGIGNYVINVVEENKIVYSLYMMDSNENRDYSVNGEIVKGMDYIYPDQIQWYEDNVNSINKIAGYNVPSMAFFHIPLPEYLIAYELAEKGSSEATLIGGVKREGVGAPMENTGFFDKMLQLGSTKHVFVGHDHINNFTVVYKGIYLTYGVKLGEFSSHDRDIIGGTIITVADEVTIERQYV